MKGNWQLVLVTGDSGRRCHPRELPVTISQPPVTLSPFLSPSGDGNDLASFVKAAGGANPVRDIRSSTLRAGAQLRKFQHAIICPPHSLPALRWFTLGYTHNSMVQNFSLFSSAQVAEADSCSRPAPVSCWFCRIDRPLHSGSHNGCCGNARRISSRM